MNESCHAKTRRDLIGIGFAGSGPIRPRWTCRLGDIRDRVGPAASPAMLAISPVVECLEAALGVLNEISVIVYEPTDQYQKCPNARVSRN
jgi:hypothetical protein